MAMIDPWRQAGQGFRTGGQISASSLPVLLTGAWLDHCKGQRLRPRMVARR